MNWIKKLDWSEALFTVVLFLLASMFIVYGFIMFKYSGNLIDETKSELLKNDYIPIDVGERSWFKCPNYKPISTKFTALSPNKIDTIQGCLCESGFGHRQLVIFTK